MELLNTFDLVQRNRPTRTVADAKRAFEFVAQVTCSDPCSDAMRVYQGWIANCAEVPAEDGCEFLADRQKVAGAKLVC